MRWFWPKLIKIGKRIAFLSITALFETNCSDGSQGGTCALSWGRACALERLAALEVRYVLHLHLTVVLGCYVQVHVFGIVRLGR